MELLFISHKYPPAVGGMEKQSYELITGMQRYAKVHQILYDGTGSRIRFFTSLQKKIVATCRCHPGIQLIHFNDALAASFCLFHRGYNHLLKVVTVHGLDVVFPNPIYQRLILPLFNRFNSIIAVSEATAEACKRRGIQAEKIKVIHNGVSHSLGNSNPVEDKSKYLKEKFRIDLKGRKVLIAMGRAVQRKGFSWFIQKVFPLLKHPAVLLLIGPYTPLPASQNIWKRMIPGFIRRQADLFSGRPTDEPILQALLAQTHWKEKVFHLGKLPQTEIVQLLMVSDAFIMPNIDVPGDMEGFGLVCLEAVLCGATVFAANSGGISSAIRHEQNGILLPSGNKAAWANALNDFFDDPSIWQIKLANNRSFTIREYSWYRMTSSYWQHFQGLVTGEQKLFE